MICGFETLMQPCIVVGFFLFSFVASEIPLGSKLFVSKNESWVSSNGDFALAFFAHTDQSSQYGIGICFNLNSIPIDKHPVVWVAGGDVPVSNTSYFQLTLEGELVLSDPSSGGEVWTSKTNNLSVVSALLHDNGNLVLMKTSGDVVWQSFDTPSDTLLPGQTLSAYQTLRAASRNSLSSYYNLCLSNLGLLQLKWESNITFWTSGSSFSVKLSAVLNSNGSFQLVDERFRVVWSVFAEDHNDAVKFRFLRLDVDGNLRLYSWDEASASWMSVWQAVENQCEVFATCGLHGVCVFNDLGSPVCKCPNGFTKESNLKCLAPYGHSCDSSVTMETYKHTFLYGIYPPNDRVFTASLEQCKYICRENPLCTAVTFLDDGTARCRMKTTQYITGYSDPSVTPTSFVKTCLDPMAVLPVNNSVSPPPLTPHPYSKFKRSYSLSIHCVIFAAFSTFCVFFAIQIAVGFWLFKRRVSARRKASLVYAGSNSAGLLIWTYTEIKELTENFKHQIGPFSFKGRLPSNRLVIFKQLTAPIEEREFRTVTSVVRSISHRNLVKLEGYCSDSGHRFLVYEYVKHGSLKKCMYDPRMCTRLTWKKRMRICLNVARAISYLHTECREFVSHGRLNCRNIVLDENFDAKVREFGLLRLDSDSCNSVEYAKKDVEDFGKVVLALINGGQEREEAYKCCYDKWIGRRGAKIVDERIQGEVDLEELERSLRIAFWCLQVDERLRPPMAEVVKVLEGTLTVDLPPRLLPRWRHLNEQTLQESELGFC